MGTVSINFHGINIHEEAVLELRTAGERNWQCYLEPLGVTIAVQLQSIISGSPYMDEMRFTYTVFS